MVLRAAAVRPYGSAAVTGDRVIDLDGPVLLAGFAVGAHASLGDEPVRVGPLAKITFLVGRNNHGKSTLLRVSQLFAGYGVDEDFVRTVMPGERTLVVGGRRLRRELLVTLTEGAWPAQLSRVNGWDLFCRLAADRDLGIVRRDVFQAWVELEPGRTRVADVDRLDLDGWAQALGQRPEARALAEALVGPSRAALECGSVGTLLREQKGPSWAHVPAFREIVAADGKPAPSDLDRGTGLTDMLLDWQSPDTADRDHQAKEDRFARLKALLQDVLEDSTARIHIPGNKRTIQIATAQTGGQRLDIEQLGDGIKQIVMLGAVALRHDHTLVCLEEPEIHLHPGMQRRLMAHLRERTTNQYLVATHSAHILDTEGAAVFHVVHDGTGTRVTEGVRVDDLARVGEDLGYRASDLLQANYVVWVEGPADRIYWRRWLELVDPALQEGVHYTAMSFGGSLEADLTLGTADQRQEAPGTAPEAASVQDLADLLLLGRRCTVIVDSDKTAAEAQVRPAVTRLQEAADASGTGELLCMEHVRTVENLVPAAVLTAAVRDVHKKAGASFQGHDEPFRDPFDGFGGARPSKARVARAAAPLLGAPDVDGPLRTAVTATAARIRSANGLPPAMP